MAATLDAVLDEIAAIQRARARRRLAERPRWPMIVLRTPKGWTGPKEVDGKPVEGTWRSHQVPLGELARPTPSTSRCSRSGCAVYRPEELFDDGRRAARPSSPRSRRRATGAWAPTRTPTAALLLRDLELPDFRDYAVDVPAPGATRARRRACSAACCATSIARQRRPSFRIFGPDETASNRLGAVFEATDRAWMARAPADATTTSRPTAA